MSWTDIFTGGIVKSVENLASEWIETDMETAEAKALMVKTLDPNGKMPDLHVPCLDALSV